MNNSNTLRVVTVGDSLAYGTGDENYTGLAKRLEAELQRRGLPGAEAVNLGVAGAQTSDVKSRLRQARVREEVRAASAIVLSIGANDLFRSPSLRELGLQDPMSAAHRILDRISAIVAELQSINGRARILILGAYNPVPGHPLSMFVNDLVELWDETLASRFVSDARIAVVKMVDVVTPERLSRFDRFHPGGAAYAEIASCVAEMLAD
jgi:lysophospholipase L1-like esterase